MHPQWFGDSYDVVKRFFVEVLSDAGFETFVDPMLTSDWDGIEADFYRFLKAKPLETYEGGRNVALFLDPDTGVGKRPSPQHTTVPLMAEKLSEFPIVFSFDQSFSRGKDSRAQIAEKLAAATELGASAFFYDSHARFLFLAESDELCHRVMSAILSVGLPRSRLLSA